MQGLWGRSQKYAIIPVEDYQRDRLVVSMAYGHTVQSYCFNIRKIALLCSCKAPAITVSPPAASSSSLSDTSPVADCIVWISSEVIENPASLAISRAASGEADDLSFPCSSVSDFYFF